MRGSISYYELMHVITNEDREVFYKIIKENIETLPKGLKEKIIRFMNDLHEAVDNLHAIHTHRTPISLKAYCLIFIYIFPLIYTPTIIAKIGADTTIWITYFVVILSQFILISLYNIFLISILIPFLYHSVLNYMFLICILIL